MELERTYSITLLNTGSKGRGEINAAIDNLFGKLSVEVTGREDFEPLTITLDYAGVIVTAVPLSLTCTLIRRASRVLFWKFSLKQEEQIILTGLTNWGKS